MRKTQLKLAIISAFTALAIIYGLSGRPVGAFAEGPPAARTGAPGELICADCHFGHAVNSGPGVLTLTGLPANYAPNQEVTLTVTLTQAQRARYGFEATALDDSGRQAGTIIVADTVRTQLTSAAVGGNLRSYIEHTFAGVSPSGANQGSWMFKWRAPSTSVGRVTFYVAGNAANGDNNLTGDFIYSLNVSTQPQVSLPPVATVSAASFNGPSLASAEIVAAFGNNLADGEQVAAALPLPTQLGGTQVEVKDSANIERAAPLFFVSPTQVNYQIPPGTALGAATITIIKDHVAVGSGSAQIAAIAPGLFTANADGKGVPAAFALRVKADLTQTNEPVAQFDAAQNKFVALPLDLGPDLGANSDQVFLVLFGTGIRFNGGLAGITATIGGVDAQVTFAGAQGGFVGLDQVNLRLPRSLAGRGDVDLVLKVDGQMANVVTVKIR